MFVSSIGRYGIFFAQFIGLSFPRSVNMMLKIALILLVFLKVISQEVGAESSGCEIPPIWGGSLREEKFGDWYWTYSGYKRSVTFETVPSGSIVSSGRVLWFYCDEPYSVLGTGKLRIEIRCSKGKWSKDLQCLRDGALYIPTTARSILRHFTTTQKPFLRSSTTTQSLPPLTTPSPGDIEQITPTNLDDGRPRSEVTPHSSTEECFCVYTLDDDNIVAHADGKRLIHGDEVRIGSTVVFHCKHVGYHRFTGNREITCNDCLPWRSSDLPSCTSPGKGDAVILFPNDVNVLEDGKTELFKGQSVNFTCAAMETAMHPEWRGQKVYGLTIIRELKERKNQGDVVYFTHLEIENATLESEGTYECSIEGNHKTSIHVIVTDPDLQCPEFLEDDGIIIKYENERRENSKASFSCPKKGQELIGKPLVTCLRTGNWSDPPPLCSGDCEIPPIWGGSLREEKFGDWYWTLSGYKRGLTFVTVPSGSVVSSGKVLWFYCDEPYSILGTGKPRIEIRCLKGKWSMDLQCFSDNVTCSRFLDSPGQEVVYSKNVSVGSVASFSCAHLNTLVGNRNTTCQYNGTWSHSPPTCESNVTCYRFPLSLDVEVVYSKETSAGSVASFSCVPPNILVGSMHTICQYNGIWSNPPPTCEGILVCHLETDHSSHLLIEPMKESYNFGEFVFLSCPPGKEMTSNVERLMCLGRTWSESLPDCKEPE